MTSRRHLEAERVRDARRREQKPWRKWYNTKRWRDIRADVLARHPVCQMCNIRDSTICDHTERHDGDPIKFWRGPFQALCKTCHDGEKQRLEWQLKALRARPSIGSDGWPDEQQPSLPKGWVSKDELFLPTDLRPSRVPLVIVAGAPASGKTTYVDQHAGPDDIRIDADIEAKRLGIPRYTTYWPDRVRILKARNDRLRELSTATRPRAWFTATLPRPEERAHFAGLLKPESVVVIHTAPEICIKRIKEARPDAPANMIRSVNRWHTEFSMRSNESVQRTV